MIKSFSKASIIILMSLGTFVCCTKSNLDYNKAVVAKVNGSELTVVEFSEQLLRKLKHLDALNVKESTTIKKAKNEVISDFILRSLVEQFAKANKIIVKTDSLKAEIKKLQKGYPDKFAFQEALVENGVSFEEWQAKVRSGLLQKAVFDEVKKQVQDPSDSELKSYYNEHKKDFTSNASLKLQQIVLSTEGDAGVVLAQLKKGSGFGELAKKFSIAPEAADEGHLGWVEKGSFEAFNEANTLRINRYTDAVKSYVGFHVIKLLGKRGSRTESYKDAKDKIKPLLLEKKHKVTLIQWFENQVRSAKVFKDQKLIDAIDVVTQE